MTKIEGPAIKSMPQGETGTQDAPVRSSGRKASGKSRSVIERASAKNHRANLIASGRVESKTFILPSTKKRLAELKVELGKATIGEVIDTIIAGLK